MSYQDERSACLLNLVHRNARISREPSVIATNPDKNIGKKQTPILHLERSAGPKSQSADPAEGRNGGEEYEGTKL